MKRNRRANRRGFLNFGGEQLERRELLTAVALSDGVLSISGSEGDNHVAIMQNDDADTIEVVVGEIQAGDANRDFQFNESDLIEIFSAGKYDNGQPATWSEGDWNGDGFFDQSDLVAAFSAGNYRSGFTGESFTFQSSSVELIEAVFAANGNDSISYSLLSETKFDKALTVNAGEGADEIDVNLNGHDIGSHFSILIWGEAGNDLISVDSMAPGQVAGQQVIESDADFFIGIDGGSDADEIAVNLTSSIQGMAWLAVFGEAGADDIRTTFHGELEGHLNLIVNGGDGDDTGETRFEVTSGFGSAYYEDESTIELGADAIDLKVDVQQGSLIGLFDFPQETLPEASISVNLVDLDREDIRMLEAELRANDPEGKGVGLLPAYFWYDSISGAVGLYGEGWSGFFPTDLSLSSEIPWDASTVVSRYFGQPTTWRIVNGREITWAEYEYLRGFLPQGFTAGNYFLDSNGDFGTYDPQTGIRGPVAVNVVEKANQQQAQPPTPRPEPFTGQDPDTDYPLSSGTYNPNPGGGVFSTYDHTGIAVMADGGGTYVFCSSC